MGARPNWRTPSKNYPKRAPANFWMLVEKRKPFHDLSVMPQCHGVVKSTGQRCKCVCVTGSDYCCKHGGIRNLEKRIQKIGGPTVRKYSVVSLSGQNIKKRLDVGASFALEEEIGQLDLPIHVKRELASLGLGARGRKYMEILAKKKSL
jgi:hypothetical protein